MEKYTMQSPKVVELSFRVFEDLIKNAKFTTKDELLLVAYKARDNANSGDYPEELKLAYEEAINKINSIGIEQILEIKDLLQD